jgi:hypothetical protein
MKTTSPTAKLTRKFVEAVKSHRSKKVVKIIAQIEAEDRLDAGAAISAVLEACALLGIESKRTCSENHFSTILTFKIGSIERRFQYAGSQYKYVCTPSAIASLLFLVDAAYWQPKSYRWSRRNGMWDEFIPFSGPKKGSERIGYFLFLRAVYGYNAKDAWGRAKSIYC